MSGVLPEDLVFHSGGNSVAVYGVDWPEAFVQIIGGGFPALRLYEGISCYDACVQKQGIGRYKALTAIRQNTQGSEPVAWDQR